MTTDTEREGGAPREPEPKPISAGLAFSGICAVRNTEASLRWLGAQMGFYLNFPGYAAAIFRLLVATNRWEFLVISGGCLFVATANIFLLYAIIRDGRLFDFWTYALVDLERTNGIEGGVQIFTSQRFERLRSSRNRLQNRLVFAFGTCIVLWVMIATIAFTIWWRTGAPS